MAGGAPPPPPPPTADDDASSCATLEEGEQEEAYDGPVTFFAEFDDLVGPKIVFDEPAAFMNTEKGKRLWQTFSDYAITDNALLDGKVVTVKAGKDALVCVPGVLRDEEKYPRNALLFALGVFTSAESVRVTSEGCSAALRRLTRSIRAMEQEHSFLSKEADGVRDPRLAQVIPGVLQALLKAANAAAGGYPVVSVPRRRDENDDDANVLCLRRSWALTVAPREAPPPLQHWQVPVLLARPRELLALNKKQEEDVARWHDSAKWDLAVQQVIPHVDGVRNARQLAAASHVDVSILLRCLRVLKHFGCLAVMDTFQYSNIYRCTARLGLLVAKPALDACGDFVLKSDNKAPLQILRLYCAFGGSETVSDVLAAAAMAGEAAAGESAVVEALDHRAFVAFGVIHGLLKRVHRYPRALKMSPDLPRRRRQHAPPAPSPEPEPPSPTPSSTSSFSASSSEAEAPLAEAVVVPEAAVASPKKGRSSSFSCTSSTPMASPQLAPASPPPSSAAKRSASSPLSLLTRRSPHRNPPRRTVQVNSEHAHTIGHAPQQRRRLSLRDIFAEPTPNATRTIFSKDDSFGEKAARVPLNVPKKCDEPPGGILFTLLSQQPRQRQPYYDNSSFFSRIGSSASPKYSGGRSLNLPLTTTKPNLQPDNNEQHYSNQNPHPITFVPLSIFPTKLPQRTLRLIKLCDGSRCMDEICSELELPVSKIERILYEAGYKTLDVYK